MRKKPFQSIAVALVACLLLIPDSQGAGFLESLELLLDNSSQGITEELDQLPLHGTVTTSALGFRSSPLPQPDSEHWVQVDLRREMPIDSIALVPVGQRVTANGVEQIGFPHRFKVEIGLDANLSDGITVYESGQDEPFQNVLPWLFESKGTIGRFVRVTCTKARSVNDEWIWTLGELVVLSGLRNVALNRTITHSGGATHNPPIWRAENLTDGRSILEIPRAWPNHNEVLEFEPSAESNAVKWVQVDLGRSYPVDELRIFPVDHVGGTGRHPGAGFPPRFVITIGYDPEFREAVTLFDHRQTDYPNPGNNPVTISGGRQQFRFVRLTTHHLWANEPLYYFALSELQAYSEGLNVALNKTVGASDPIESDSLARLTDGHASGHLVEWPDYLKGLNRRRELGVQLHQLNIELNQARRLVFRRAATGGAVLMISFVIWLVSFRRRQGREKERLVTDVREQIASDLHDDLGSNLGSISMLADLGGKGDDPSAENTFGEIGELARETAESMQDIVWLLKEKNSTLRGLVARIRTTMERRLKDISHELTLPFSLEDRSLPATFIRNLFLLFKEAVNNAAKHSDGDHIDTAIKLDDGHILISVTDNGRGFNSENPPTGNGLGNLRDRVALIGGSLEINSVPDRGTTVLISALLPR